MEGERRTRTESPADIACRKPRAVPGSAGVPARPPSPLSCLWSRQPPPPLLRRYAEAPSNCSVVATVVGQLHDAGSRKSALAHQPMASPQLTCRHSHLPLKGSSNEVPRILT
ncbi:unnamed protein product [Chrysodeixis includens]|uniref:Uncharacterized protein n=1 Tax=Chrysodeixis includens TaxID=689277 RepID=A0A9N8PX19_CHRIL|nr:unnamed protein product [Chrysodeixis includens]